MSFRIPFNKPSLQGSEIDHVLAAINNGHISGDGAFTKRCHTLLEQIVGCGKALLTTSCTDALELSSLLLELRPEDEVVLPSFTFVSTVNAFALRGVRPVFADVRPDTLNLDERQLEGLITPRTRAICVVHYGGVGCEMDTIMAVAGRHGIPVVEDNAHGLFGKYRGRNLGTFGALATQSFHETKNISCGEGGALLLNDVGLVERAEILREKGTNRSRFFRGQVDKYTWVDLGSSFLPSDMLAAFLLAQLNARERIQARRQAIWARYHQTLADLEPACGISLPHVPPECEHPAHLFYLLMRSEQQRAELITHLKQRGILAVFHYLPLHLSPMGLRLGGRPGQCPVTERVADRLLRLPLFNTLTEHEQDEVIAAVREFFALS
jgi:dTDP-4-amino-4,6-dideoxygalactose transaminase